MYAEVTGYFIPTLLEAGNYALADSFGKALIAAQYQDGSFGLGGESFVFDTAMAVRGLLALARRRPANHRVRSSLALACDWLSAPAQIDPKTQRWVVPSHTKLGATQWSRAYLRRYTPTRYPSSEKVW